MIYIFRDFAIGAIQSQAFRSDICSGKTTFTIGYWCKYAEKNYRRLLGFSVTISYHRPIWHQFHRDNLLQALETSNEKAETNVLPALLPTHYSGVMTTLHSENTEDMQQVLVLYCPMCQKDTWCYFDTKFHLWACAICGWTHDPDGGQGVRLSLRFQ